MILRTGAKLGRLDHIFKDLTNIREALELYIEDCREAGDPVPTEANKEFIEVEAA